MDELTREACDYFSHEINEMDGMLKGILSPHYREHLEKKRRYYKVALKFITALQEASDE